MTAADAIRETARHLAEMLDADALATWRHCGSDTCQPCDEIEHARAMRAMQSRTKTKER